MVARVCVGLPTTQQDLLARRIEHGISEVKHVRTFSSSKISISVPGRLRILMTLQGTSDGYMRGYVSTHISQRARWLSVFYSQIERAQEKEQVARHNARVGAGQALAAAAAIELNRALPFIRHIR